MIYIELESQSSTRRRSRLGRSVIARLHPRSSPVYPACDSAPVLRKAHVTCTVSRQMSVYLHSA